MRRPVVRVTVRDGAGAVRHTETRSAFNSGIRAGEDAVRQIARSERTQYEGQRPTTQYEGKRPEAINDTYTRRWVSERGDVLVVTVTIERGSGDFDERTRRLEEPTGTSEARHSDRGIRTIMKRDVERNQAEYKRYLIDAVYDKTHPDYRSKVDGRKAVLINGPRGATLTPLESMKTFELERMLHSGGDVRETGGHMVADFNDLDTLIAHARDEGASHVLVDGPDTRLYYPRGGQYSYEEASVWRKAGFWHAQGPGARTGVARLPEGAQRIGGGAGGRRAAEAPRRRPEGPESFTLDGGEFAARRIGTGTSKAMSGAPSETWAVDPSDTPGAAILQVTLFKPHGQLWTAWTGNFIRARDRELAQRVAAARNGTGMQEPRRVEDYIAVDRRGRTTAGPFKSYGDAKGAAGPADYVQFVPAGRLRETLSKAVFKKGQRVFWRARLFGDTERHYGAIVTGTPRNMRVEGVGSLEPHYRVRHEDDGGAYWMPASSLHPTPASG